MGIDGSTAAASAAAAADARLAVRQFDNAGAWVAGGRTPGPLAVEVWLFDADLVRVFLVSHRWRGWVPPGGKVEPGETPREAAGRELFEETGLRVELLSPPAAAAIRSYHPDWPATLGLSYAAIGDTAMPLVPESGQPVAWTPLAHDWPSSFPDDPARIRWHASWLAAARTAAARPRKSVPPN